MILRFPEIFQLASKAYWVVPEVFGFLCSLLDVPPFERHSNRPLLTCQALHFRKHQAAMVQKGEFHALWSRNAQAFFLKVFLVNCSQDGVSYFKVTKDRLSLTFVGSSVKALFRLGTRCSQIPKTLSTCTGGSFPS